jgi:hypothetical protein
MPSLTVTFTPPFVANVPEAPVPTVRFPDTATTGVVNVTVEGAVTLIAPDAFTAMMQGDDPAEVTVTSPVGSMWTEAPDAWLMTIWRAVGGLGIRALSVKATSERL